MPPSRPLELSHSRLTVVRSCSSSAAVEQSMSSNCSAITTSIALLHSKMGRVHAIGSSTSTLSCMRPLPHCIFNISRTRLAWCTAPAQAHPHYMQVLSDMLEQQPQVKKHCLAAAPVASRSRPFVALLLAAPVLGLATAWIIASGFCMRLWRHFHSTQRHISSLQGQGPHTFWCRFCGECVHHMRQRPDVPVGCVGAAQASEGAALEIVGISRAQDAAPGGSVYLHRKEEGCWCALGLAGKGHSGTVQVYQCPPDLSLVCRLKCMQYHSRC